MDFTIKEGVLEEYKGKDKTVVIPDGVTEIGICAFYGRKSLKEIIIPGGVTKIGAAAFDGCKSLEKVVIPDSVTEIGDDAFNGCTSLKEINIPGSVKKIGGGAFSGCKFSKDEKGFVVVNGILVEYYGKDKTVVIPDGVTAIGSHAFKDCTSLEKVVIPDSVTEIGEYAFDGCESLKDIIIPNSVTEIGYLAFEGCELSKDEKGFVVFNGILVGYFGEDETVVIPDSVTKIGGGAFHFCDIREIIIPDSVKEIGLEAFFSCSSLEKVVIPGSVTKIGERVFECCYSLEKVVIQDGVKKIGDSAFCSCSSLEKVVIPDSVTEIGDIAFERCESLKEIIIPGSVTKIGVRAFFWCESLEKVVIPDSVTEIGEGAFDGCKSLESVSIPGVNILKKKYKELVIKDISDELNKYVNTTTKALLYFDSINELENLNYKTDLCKYPNIIIRGHEDIKLTDEERKIISSQLKEKCKEDENLYIPLAFFADDDTVNEFVDNISIWMKGKKKDKERVMRVKGALLLNDTISAQKYFEKIDKLDIYAKKRNLDVDDLQDQLLSDFGLDHDGKTEYVLEDNTITVSLQNDLKFILTDNTGKVIKSISKKTDKGIKANEEYSKLKKDVKEAAKMVNNKLFKDFLSGKSRDGKSWSNIWLNNPVMKIMARLIVWQQNDNTFTLHDDNKAYLVDNTPYEISNEPVSVAHPLEMKENELIKWRQYFIDNSIKQPFEQVWEPVMQAKDIKPDRYNDTYIPLYAIMNKDKHGIIMKGQSELSLKGCSANLELIESDPDWINNQFEITNFRFNKYTRYVNHIVSIFDKGTVEDRIKKDDISVSIYLDRFTLAQITDFIDIATKNKCTNVSALLLQYKHDHYPDYDHIDELILDL